MDVEIQQDNEGASPKRARYHSGLMDMNTLNPGQDFDELPESYVIFITRDDVLGYGLPIYHVNRKIEEVSENFKDEAHIIYVNSKKQDDTELGRLMHDLHCKNAGDMHSKILADRVHELKETQKGVEFMCREMEQIYSEGIENGEKLGIAKGEKLGIEKGELKKAKTSALSMAADGMQVSKIAHYLNVSVQMVQKWIDENVQANHKKNQCLKSRHRVIVGAIEKMEFMCREMEQIHSEGIESGEMQKAKETTIALAEMGLPADKIAKAVKISVDIVQKWIDESMSVAH